MGQLIEHIVNNPDKQFSLEELATIVDLSPTHLQKIFTQWAGVSAKQFQRFLTVEYAKGLLSDQKTTLQTSLLSGLSSSGRLHDLFVDIEAMTPGEFKNGGQNLIIDYSVYNSQFGFYLIASTTKGICNLIFIDSKDSALDKLLEMWPNAKLNKQYHQLHQPVIDFFDQEISTLKIKLHLKGTNYQLKVWNALLRIPESKITSYGEIAKSIGDNSGFASRAVGTAVG
ncbi:MAG: bifunctional helix-turn-helix domain-containing protein/methylated-DNA--[protein]-cysteine S-methyltransferase, partial [Patescibacteria group bacterium]